MTTPVPPPVERPGFYELLARQLIEARKAMP